MKHQFLLGLAVLALTGCATDQDKPMAPRKVSVNGREYLVPTCRPLVRYSGRTWNIQGLEIPIGGAGTVKVGAASLDAKQLQQATAIAQIVDLHRVATCELLPSFTTDRKEFLLALKQMRDDQTIITQFAIAAQDPQALRDFIARYSARANLISDKAQESSGGAPVVKAGAVIDSIKKDPDSATLEGPKKAISVTPTEKLFSKETLEKAKAAGVVEPKTASSTTAQSKPAKSKKVKKTN